MAGKEIRNRITLDASRFERGATAVNRAARRMQQQIGVGMLRAVRSGALAIAAAGTGMAAGITVGVKKAIDLGGNLAALRDQTGGAVAELMVMQRVLEDNNVAAEQARKALNRMQKQIIDAGEGLSTPIRAFDRLGISVDDLRKLSTIEQFQAIAAALHGIEDETLKAGTAMDIFGRAGAELQGIFGEDWSNAAASIGKQAELLQKNADLFFTAGTLLDRLGGKLQGFFVGIADKVVPAIMPLLERLDKLDLAGQGQKFGQSLADGINAIVGFFASNTISEIFSESLVLALTTALNHFVRGWAAIFAGTGKMLWDGLWEVQMLQLQAWRDLATGLVNSLRSGFGKLVDFLRNGFIGVAGGFIALLMDGVGKLIARIPGMSEQGKLVQQNAARYRQTAQSRRDQAREDFGDFAGDHFDPLIQTLKNAPSELADKITEGFLDGFLALDGWEMISTDQNKARIKDLIGNAITTARSGNIHAVDSPEISAFDPDDESGLNDLFDRSPTAQALTGGVSSLASIGGGGGVGAASGIETAVDAGNEILRGIRNELRGMRNTQTGMRNTPIGVDALSLA